MPFTMLPLFWVCGIDGCGVCRRWSAFWSLFSFFILFLFFTFTKYYFHTFMVIKHELVNIIILCCSVHLYCKKYNMHTTNPLNHTTCCFVYTCVNLSLYLRVWLWHRRMNKKPKKEPEISNSSLFRWYVNQWGQRSCQGWGHWFVLKEKKQRHLVYNQHL